MRLDNYPQYCVGQNSSWFRSAWLGLKIGILWGPSRLAHALFTPTLAFLSSTGLLFVSVGVWIIGTIGVIALGFAGYVIEDKPIAKKTASKV